MRLTSVRWSTSSERAVSFAIESLSPARKRVFYLLALALSLSAFALVARVNDAFLAEVPSRGGMWTEGVIGLPRFINPLLAISDTDRDLTLLTYSGLMRPSANGGFEYDLAQTHTVSDDGLVYTFTLKSDLVWSDGKPITADDVVFTIEKTQDTTLKSPRRASWNEVAVKKISDTDIEFSLKTPYAPFMENATMGILPKHIWERINAEQFGFNIHNTEPVGSGPYQVARIKRDGSGNPLSYDLVPFDGFALGAPHIGTLRIKFYPNEQELVTAFSSGEVEAVSSISPETARTFTDEQYRIFRSPLPRVFAIFLNQNKASLFTDKTVRKALSLALDREAIVSEALMGYATPIDTPIPPGAFGYEPMRQPDVLRTTEDKVKSARELLEKDGWKFDETTRVLTKKTKNTTQTLSFSIATSEVPELKKVAEAVEKTWEAMGANIELKVFEIGDLNQNIIRPREYEALFFGEVVGRSSDLFAFWHSSQRLDPGLNIALYANITADKLLEEARTEADEGKRAKKFSSFQEEVRKDIPAFFLYSPDFIYILPERIKGVTLASASIPSERFLHIHKAYIATERVWRMFRVN